MTREEAKDYIREWCPYDRQEEIIKALVQKPCEDAISRQALLEEIENGIKAGNYEEGYEEYPHINDMDDIIECIKYADSIQPKPKTGHWKIIPSNNNGEYRPNKYGCSECGWEIDLCRGLQQDTGHRLFCEHCGANMENEE